MARPKIAILSKSLIRDQALAIIDECGLNALTMRNLAGRLGVQAPSLYSHFSNKDAVLDAVVNRLAKNIDPHQFTVSWQIGLRAWAETYYDVIQHHPNTAPIFASGTWERSEYLAMVDQVHGGLLRYGWSARNATMVAASTMYLVLGAGTTTFATGFADDSSAYRELYPNLIQAHKLKKFASTIDRDSFTLALDSLISGLELKYNSRIRGARGAPTD